MGNNEAIIYTRLDDLVPNERLTRKLRAPEKGCWRLVDYETVNGLKGRMIYAAPEDDAGELTLPLEVEGSYRMYLGINYTRAAFGDMYHHIENSIYGQLEAKLSSDIGFRRFACEICRKGAGAFRGKGRVGKKRDKFDYIHEVYWKTADLTGEELIIRPPGEPYNDPELRNVTNLSYIKLVPAGEKEIEAVNELTPRDGTRKLALFWCTGILSGHTKGSRMYHPTDPQWFKNEFQPFVNSDIGILVFEAIRGSLCIFNSSIGDVGTPDGNWPEDWIDPLEAFTELAHEHNMKIFVGIRMVGAGYPVIRNPINWASFHWNNVRWAKRDKEGMPCSNPSIAFPEVREFWLSLLREALDYGVDGVQLHLKRSYPFVLYEEPVLESFKAKYGEDPRDLPDDDPRMLEHSSEYVSGFLREIRRLLDEKPGRELGVTVRNVPGKERPMDFQCDVETWLDEGLVDYVMPTEAVDKETIDRWKGINKDCQIWPDTPRFLPGNSGALLAKKYYSYGADGLAMWDGERRPPLVSEWSVVSHLGHEDMLDYLIKEAPDYFNKVKLKYLNGLAVEQSFFDG